MLRIKRDVYSWSSLILAHVNARDVGSAHRTLFQMIGYGVRPDAACYNVLLAAYAKDGAVDHALHILQAGTHGYAPLHSVTRGYTAFPLHHPSPLLTPFIHTSQEMLASGVAASGTSHAIMANALVKAGRVQQADAALSGLLEAGERPPTSAFNAVISGHSQAGQPWLAQSVMQRMLVRPTVFTPCPCSSYHLARRGEQSGDVTCDTSDSTTPPLPLPHSSFPDMAFDSQYGRTRAWCPISSLTTPCATRGHVKVASRLSRRW